MDPVVDGPSAADLAPEEADLVVVGVGGPSTVDPVVCGPSLVVPVAAVADPLVAVADPVAAAVEHRAGPGRLRRRRAGAAKRGPDPSLIRAGLWAFPFLFFYARLG